MSGPWEQYQERDDGPWAQYAEAEQPKPKVAALKDLPKNAPKQGRLDRLVQGFRDPIDGGAQLLTKMLPDGVVQAGNNLNNWIADKTGMVARLPDGGVDQQVREREAQYQQARTAAGESGFDGYRMAGNVISPANLAVASKLPQVASLGGRVAIGAGYGGGSAALAPVTTGDNYAAEKAKQIATGAAFGGLMPTLTGAASRIISPKASRNPDLAMLKAEGVKPTIGQTLGGRWNALEEKLQSLPIVGDAIASARTKSLEQFNNAALNRATVKGSARIDSIGQKGVMDAGDRISGAYDDALTSLGPVKFDGQFAAQAQQLQSMAKNLTPDMQRKFEKTYRDAVVGRMSPNGSMLPDTFKKVDSELGTIAARYGKSTVASEQEAGDAIKQLRQILKEQAARSSPQSAQKLKAADAAYANLVRVEGAAKAAENNSGIFTPAQLNQAVRTADSSVRKRAVSRGQALMQDLGGAGQNVIGNKVPNSFTADRALIAGGTLGSYFLNPAIPAGLLGGAAMYSAPVQRLLTAAASARPQAAKAIADALDKRAAYALPFGAQLGLGLLNQ